MVLFKRIVEHLNEREMTISKENLLNMYETLLSGVGQEDLVERVKEL